jgi:hypothetical protein
MPIKPGWTGRVFEDFEVGDVYRTVMVYKRGHTPKIARPKLDD